MTTVLHVTAVEFSVRTLLVPQLRALRERGFDVRVASAPEGSDFGPDVQPFRPVRIDVPRQIQPARMSSAALRVAALARSLQPAVLHLHSPSIALTARLLPRGLLPRHTRIVHTVHGFLQRWDPPMSLRNRFLDRLEWYLSRKTDALLFQSHEDFEEASRRGYHGRLVYLGNGVQDQWFELPMARRHDPMRLLFVGRLIREKGTLDLVDAVAGVPGVELSIVGGQARGERSGIHAELEARIADLDLGGRVRMLGVLQPEDLPTVMAEHDVLVLPTYFHEGVPRSIIEAMAAGRPIIATPIHGCRELVVDGENGYLVAFKAVTELAGAIRRIGALPPDGFAAMAAASRRRADDMGRESKVVRRLLGVYDDLGVCP